MWDIFVFVFQTSVPYCNVKPINISLIMFGWKKKVI